MNLEKLAVSLGLPKESTETVVFEALAKRDAEGRAAVESLSALTSELPKHGFTLNGKALVRVEPLKLDLTPEASDTPKEAELKKRLLEAEQEKTVASLSSNKDFVKKIAGDLKMPPAMMSLAEEILGVRGELEAVCLSKDGKVEVKKTSDFPKKMRSLFEQLASFKGVKFSTPSEEPKTSEELAKQERAKLAEELTKKHQPEEAAAAK